MKQIQIEAIPNSRLTKNRRRSLSPFVEAKLIRESRQSAFFIATDIINRLSQWDTLTECRIKGIYYFSNRPPDYDGLAVMVAPIIDGLVDAGVMEDDSPNIVKEYSFSMEKTAKRADRRVVITVSEL